MPHECVWLPAWTGQVAPTAGLGGRCLPVLGWLPGRLFFGEWCAGPGVPPWMARGQEDWHALAMAKGSWRRWTSGAGRRRAGVVFLGAVVVEGAVGALPRAGVRPGGHFPCPRGGLGVPFWGHLLAAHSDSFGKAELVPSLSTVLSDTPTQDGSRKEVVHEASAKAGHIFQAGQRTPFPFPPRSMRCCVSRSQSGSHSLLSPRCPFPPKFPPCHPW